MSNKKTTPFLLALAQDISTCFNQKVLIRVHLTHPDTMRLQEQVYDLCLLPEVRAYLEGMQGYKGGKEEPFNHSRFLLIVHHIYRQDPRLREVSIQFLAGYIYRNGIYPFREHYVSARVLQHVMYQSKKLLPQHILQILSKQKFI